MTEDEAFKRFIGEADEDVIRNEAYEEAARLGWDAGYAKGRVDALDHIKPQVETMVRRWRAGGDVGGYGNLQNIRFMAMALGIIPKPVPVTEAEKEAAVEAFRQNMKLSGTISESWVPAIVAAIEAAKGANS